MVADFVVAVVVDYLAAFAGTRNVDHDAFGNASLRAVRHQQDAVGKQDRLVDIVRDHEDGLLRGRPDTDQLVLDGPARESIKSAERFIEEQKLRLDCECPGD